MEKKQYAEPLIEVVTIHPFMLMQGTNVGVDPTEEGDQQQADAPRLQWYEDDEELW